MRCSLEASALPVDLILECSAEPSVLAGYTSPGYVLQTNLIGTINCLELARQTEADFIFLSTSRVYPIAYLNRFFVTWYGSIGGHKSTKSLSGKRLN